MSSKSHVILIPYDMRSNFDSIHSTLVVVSKRDAIQISSQISSHFSKLTQYHLKSMSSHIKMKSLASYMRCYQTSHNDQIIPI